MTTVYFIAGSIFIVLSLVWAIVKRRQKQNAKHEEATKDAKSAIEKRDTGGLLDAVRRMRINRK